MSLLSFPTSTSPSASKLHSNSRLHHHHHHLSFPTTIISTSPSKLTNSKKPLKSSRFHLSLRASTAPTSTSSSTSGSFPSRRAAETTVLVTGATGYIGRVVVRELLRRGLRVIAVARPRSGIRGHNSASDTASDLSPASVVFSDVTSLPALLSSIQSSGVDRVDAAVCCLASRSGGVRDSWLVDYEATKNTLAAARGLSARHFVLLSAICVQKPLLEFQRAKLKFESELVAEAAADPNFTYSIVRPTAFFKSLGGQVETVKSGQPYVMFGDGRLCACKPISEQDLAAFVADCLFDEEKANKVLPIGGPGKALTPLEQGEMLFRLLGREPKFLKVPIGIMDFAIGVLDALAKVFPGLVDAAEFGKIGRYYAAESMLVLDPETGEYNADMTPSYGKDTLEEFFERVIREGMTGQELGEQTIF